MRRLTPIEQLEFAERYRIEGPLNPHPTLGSNFTGLTAGHSLGDKIIVGFQLALNGEYVILARATPNLDQKSIKDWFDRIQQPKLYDFLYRIYGNIGLMSQRFEELEAETVGPKQLTEILEELSYSIANNL